MKRTMLKSLPLAVLVCVLMVTANHAQQVPIPTTAAEVGVVPVAYNHLAMLTGYIAADQRFIACPNQDVVYGAGFFDLDKDAAVIKVPDFGDRFWVYALYDGRTAGGTPRSLSNVCTKAE